uniref:ATP synthase F(0) complex subunit e, mitochondrial n=1 Tax=Gasterosteus aculeatus aculeatus TaxID=481459 RepID=A0AAQ4QRS5_GASAC
MAPPVAVSPLIKTARYSALIAGIIYGKRRYDNLKPIAAEERRVEEAEKKVRDEQERIAKELREGNLTDLNPPCQLFDLQFDMLIAKCPNPTFSFFYSLFTASEDTILK